MELSSIANFCIRNIPGMLVVEYAPIDWIDKDAFDDWYITGADPDEFPWAGENSWLRLPLLGSSIRWNEKISDTVDGPSFSHTLTGTIPSLREEVHAVFEQTSRHRFVLKLTDKNNRSWVLGTPYMPMSFIFSAENSDSAGNSYQIEFSGISARRARGFLPA